MFTIIGGDGKEYGPVTLEQVRNWIAAGRANLDTKAKAAGSTEWRRLGDFPEFSQQLGQPPLEAKPTPVVGVEGRPLEVVIVEPADTSNLAGRGERLLAQLLDNVVGIACALPGVIMIALAAARAGLGLNGNWANLATAAGFGAGLVVVCFAMLALFGVQLWMLVTRGQTIGKRALGVRIVRLEDEVNPGFVKVFLLRAVVPAFIGAVPYLGVLFTLTDICFIFREDRRCLHDHIAGTKVVKA